MKKVFAALVATSIAALAASPASAEMTADEARAAVTPFYNALNAAFIKDAPALVEQSTTPGWLTCRGNDACNTRAEVMAGIGSRLKAIPDLKWEIKEILVAGNRVIVRGEATGTPAANFMGAATNGKSFKLMSIDVHTLEGGKIARTYHVEDWQGAFRQLSE